MHSACAVLEDTSVNVGRPTVRIFCEDDSELVLIGPVLSVGGGYAFDTWTPQDGLLSCSPYRRFEDARYGRTATIRNVSGRAIDCETHDEFAGKLRSLAWGHS
jgi:hypothetical protein